MLIRGGEVRPNLDGTWRVHCFICGKDGLYAGQEAASEVLKRHLEREHQHDSEGSIDHERGT